MGSREIRSDPRCIREDDVAEKGTSEIDRHEDDEEQRGQDQRQLNESLTTGPAMGGYAGQPEH
jgi:hypothetical protein